MARATVRFTLDDVSMTPFGPRRGTLTLTRPSGTVLTFATPTLLTPTSRGCVPHLARCHIRASPAIGLVHVPFESFLEQTPPVPTVLGGAHALHRFLGFDPDKHILALSARDPADTRTMPPNGNSHLNAYCLRGVRKLAAQEWTSHVTACSPDLVVALSDTPHTSPPFSQKRLTKSIERSLAWLAALLGSPAAILVPLAGCTARARSAFSTSLVSPSIGDLPTYDAGIAGYTLDVSLHPPSLLQTSLLPLPPTKPRFVHGTSSPHHMLRLIRDVGVDVLDARWAVDAASYGVALDFVFPVPTEAQPSTQQNIGHNLYDTRYRLDFRSLSSPSCPCIACSPTPPASRINHGPASAPLPPNDPPNAPYTRAYIHHLLHTHEMSAHALLVSHNLAMLDALLAGVRDVLASPASSSFAAHVSRFEAAYRDTASEGEEDVMSQARRMWAAVEKARGKGRLRREREAEAGGEDQDREL
ncbi:Queuine tRNA-ribosyltransferase-like protein [Termitomyces sp. T112]|nr:Queuine tRNA-ribosyltransferase-like protein [Termitomyces sp. T112]